MIRKITRFTAVALFALFAVASNGTAQMGGPPPDFTVSAEERAAAITGMIARLNEAYVFPDVARKMEQSVRMKQKRGEYDKITSARELADKLTADFREVSKDKHLRVFYNDQPVPDQDPFAEVPAEIRARQREQAARFNFGFEKVERLQGNVGYLDFRGFNPVEVAADTATAAMNFLANTDALIIDLRFNGGGEPAMVAYLSSYLFDQPVHLNSIYERPTDLTQQWWTSHVPGPRFGQKKPVFVLTASRTFSAAEEFTYNLKNLKRATIVGETTGGGAHPVMPFKASEHFSIGVPFARAINPITKTNWEGTGVTPDVAVKADEAFDTAYRLALQKVIDATKEPQRKEGLQKLLAEKSAK
jgi:retinol-binding protein 3